MQNIPYITFGVIILMVALIALFALIALVAMLKRASQHPLKARPLFTKQPLINKSEQKLFWMVARLLPKGYRLLCQVSYGEILSCKDWGKFLTINSKRADLVICDTSFATVAVIEYQGKGHFGKGKKAYKNTLHRDSQKRLALGEAKIPMIEIPAEFNATLVGDAIRPIFEKTSTLKAPTKIKRAGIDRVEPPKVGYK